MTYNIHPLFVHFPIALLFVYAILKIVPTYRWLPNVAWRQVERIFLVLGVLGGFVALSTGEIAEHLTRPDHALVEMHSTFAGASIFIFGALLVGEIIVLISTRYTLPKIVRSFGNLLTHRGVSGVLAFIGLITISVTGLLGGVMVYGVGADPVASWVMSVLGL